MPPTPGKRLDQHRKALSQRYRGAEDQSSVVWNGWAVVARFALLIGVMLIWASACFATPPAERIATLSRGINITGWFRYPVSRDPAALRAWLSDKAMSDLKHAGFTFIRLAADPALLDSAGARQVFIEQVRRLQNQGLAVVISPHPIGWSMPGVLARPRARASGPCPGDDLPRGAERASFP
jgi:hypothetical protein